MGQYQTSKHNQTKKQEKGGETSGIDGDALMSEGTKRIFSPVVKIPTGYGTRVRQLAALKEQEQDEKDSDELM